MSPGDRLKEEYMMQDEDFDDNSHSSPLMFEEYVPFTYLFTPDSACCELL